MAQKKKRREEEKKIDRFNSLVTLESLTENGWPQILLILAQLINTGNLNPGCPDYARAANSSRES